MEDYVGELFEETAFVALRTAMFSLSQLLIIERSYHAIAIIGVLH